MGKEITLEEYLKIIKQKIKKFKKKYVEGHEQDPKNFPLKMAEGDWNEQELAFRNFEVL